VATPAGAQSSGPASLVKDINPGPLSDYQPEIGGETDSGRMAEYNGILYFSMIDEIHGTELWRSDGTLSGTYILKDISPGSASSDPHSFQKVNTRLLFVADDGEHGLELWRTDGTQTGTCLVKDIDPGPSNAFSLHESRILTVFRNEAYFFVQYGLDDFGLWKSDGTDAGTQLVWQSRNVSELTVVSGDALFFVDYEAISGSELWKTDGTAPGTRLVKDIDIGPGSSGPRQLTDVNGQLFFVANAPSTGSELYVSDGTEAGTRLVKDLQPGTSGSSISELTAFNGSLVFYCYDASGDQLYRSDGTESGTVAFVTLAAREILAMSSTLFVATYNQGLWRSDGTGPGTLLLRTVASPTQLTNVNGTLFFAAQEAGAGSELWKSDGTGAGTIQVCDIQPGSGSSLGNRARMTNVNGTLFFIANDGVSGREVWKSDGSEAGTVRVTDNISYSSVSFEKAERERSWFDAFSLDRVKNVQLIGATLYFPANDGTHGTELWKSDGTASGTLLVNDICPGACSSNPSHFAEKDGILLFAADDGTYGRELWRSDGTAAGTTMVLDIRGPGSLGGGSNPFNLANVGGIVFFAAYHPTSWQEVLWKTDGTTAGTVKVKDVWIPSGCSLFTEVAGTLFFNASDSNTNEGLEIWKSDGSEAGTVRVTPDMFPDPGVWNWAVQLTSWNGLLYFSTSPGDSGFELWRTDGTEAGTFMIKDLLPGPYAGGTPVFLSPLNDALYFVGHTFENGGELWKTDGTEAGTVLVADLYPGGRTSEIVHLGNYGGRLYFSAFVETHGREIWTSDGTSAGTYLVSDILPGTSSSRPFGLFNIGTQVFFCAYDPAHGTELWRTGGNAATTTLVQDINPGSESSSVHSPMIVGDRLVFFANDGVHGLEPWSAPLATLLPPVDLRISKRHDGFFTAGSEAGYVLTVANQGTAPATQTVTVTDQLPVGMTFASARGEGWDCSASGQTVTCTRATPLPAGQVSSIGLTATVSSTATGTLTNTVSVASQDDGWAGNNSTADPATVYPATVNGGSASRTLPGCYVEGAFVDVSVATTPGAGTLVYAVEEVPPAGWSASQISDGGIWDATTHKVKWGPFFDNTARVLTYRATAPAEEDSIRGFAGLISFDGVSVGIGGQTLFEVCSGHPADSNQDFQMVINEITAYGSAWKSGADWSIPPNPIPIGYVTRAGYLWRTGEVYHEDPAQTPPLSWLPGTALAAGKLWTLKGQDSQVVGEASPATAGTGVTVTLTISPTGSTQAWAVEESPPPGWAAFGINEGGQWDARTGKVKWGPFFDAETRVLKYEVIPAQVTRRTPTFRGFASFDGVSVRIGKERQLEEFGKRPPKPRGDEGR